MLVLGSFKVIKITFPSSSYGKYPAFISPVWDPEPLEPSLAPLLFLELIASFSSKVFSQDACGKSLLPVAIVSHELLLLVVMADRLTPCSNALLKVHLSNTLDFMLYRYYSVYTFKCRVPLSFRTALAQDKVLVCNIITTTLTRLC
jgi:hypothetical protein